MILTCPNCETKYSVDPNTLAPDGKTVRCAKCGHSWMEHPPGDMPHTVGPEPEPAAAAPAPPPPAPTPTPAPEPEPEHVEPLTGTEPPPPGYQSWEEWEARPPDPEDETEAPPPEDEELDDDFEVPSIEDVTVQAGKPQRPAGASRFAVPKRSVGAIIGWTAFALVVGGLLGSGYFFRSSIMEIWPPATKLYQAAGLVRPATYALALGNVSQAQEREGETLVLIVTGDISNITEDTQAVPRLRGAILDAQSREIFTWTFDPPSPELAAGETVAFATRVPNPPEGASGVAVTFTEEEG